MSSLGSRQGPWPNHVREHRIDAVPVEEAESEPLPDRVE